MTRSMLLQRCVLGVIGALGLLSPALRADTYTYTFYLTSTTGSFNGTGSVTVTSPIPGRGFSASYGGGHELTDVTLSIDNDTFTLVQYPTASLLTLDGGISILNYHYVQLGPVFEEFQSEQTFSFYYDDQNGVAQLDQGTFGPLTLVTTSATPEPGSLLLFSTGLAGAVGVGRRRLFRPLP